MWWIYLFDASHSRYCFHFYFCLSSDYDSTLSLSCLLFSISLIPFFSFFVLISISLPLTHLSIHLHSTNGPFLDNYRVLASLCRNRVVPCSLLGFMVWTLSHWLGYPMLNGHFESSVSIDASETDMPQVLFGAGSNWKSALYILWSFIPIGPSLISFNSISFFTLSTIPFRLFLHSSKRDHNNLTDSRSSVSLSPCARSKLPPQQP